jgi:hypothetical protein
LITLPTTAHNLDRGRKGESCCALLEVVGLLLSHQLTQPNEISAALPAFANSSQFLHRQSSEFRRKVALEDSANAGVKKYVDLTHEPTDADPGFATTRDDYSLETYILSTKHYQIELLTNVDQTLESGALVMVSFPKPKGGSGFPARVFAILP